MLNVRLRLALVGWILPLSALAVLGAVALVSNLEKAYVSAVAFCAFGAVLQTKWKSRRNWRVWLFLFVFAFIHVAVISTVRFSQSQTGVVAVLVAVVDVFLLVGAINWIEKRFPGAADEDVYLAEDPANEPYPRQIRGNLSFRTKRIICGVWLFIFIVLLANDYWWKFFPAYSKLSAGVATAIGFALIRFLGVTPQEIREEKEKANQARLRR